MSNYGMTATLAAVLLGLSGSLAAAPITTSTVYDTAETQYIGADGGGYGDVVGDVNKFDIKSMEIEQNGNEFKFFINTAFAGEAGVYPWLTEGYNGIGYGDLFLANEWDPNKSAAGYANDNAVNGTDWTWGLILSDRFKNDGGEVFLAKLPGSNEQSALLSNDFMTAAQSQYRNGQEVAVDTSGHAIEKGWVELLEGKVGSWDIGTNQLLIDVNLGQTDLLNGDTLAFHWGMSCANDVIEGQVDLKKVPEPGTIGLVGLALVAMFLMRRRSKAS